MKLSVLMLTYNQEAYIAKALDSALGQRTDFDYEIVVGEDCSTDGTADVVRAYVERHPGKVRALCHPKRLGIAHNFVATYRACRGQYVASLEGDDYWISPYKLQRQADFLDSHPECVLCFHNALIVFEDGSPEGLYCRPDQKEISGLEDMLVENFVPVCASAWRREVLTEFPEWMFELLFIDWVLNVLLAAHGKYGYLPDTMAVNKKLRGGAWTGASVRDKMRTIKAMYDRFNEHLGYRYDTLIRALIPKWKYFYELENGCRAWAEAEAHWRRHGAELERQRDAALEDARHAWEGAQEEWQGIVARLEQERDEAIAELTARLEEALEQAEAARQEAEGLRHLLAHQAAQLEALAGELRSQAGPEHALLSALPEPARTGNGDLLRAAARALPAGAAAGPQPEGPHGRARPPAAAPDV